jgi:hypothetical protein
MGFDFSFQRESSALFFPLICADFIFSLRYLRETFSAFFPADLR